MTCHATRDGEGFTLTTGRIERRYRWNGGLLQHVELTDLATGTRWGTRLPGTELPGAPAVALPGALPGEAEPTGDGELSVEWVAETAVRPRHLRATVTATLGGLRVRQAFELHPGCPAIRCTFWLRGRAAADAWRSAAASEGTLRNIEHASHARRGEPTAPLLDRLAFEPRHLRAKAVEFFDITDRRNNLVAERTLVAYPRAARLRGNLLLLGDVLSGAGLFVLKEGPCSDVQLADPGFDFVVERGGVAVAGIGADPGDVTDDEWVRGYGCVVGVGSGDERDLLASLRAYQGTLRRWLPERDEMIVLNTWGDRGQDGRMGESFALGEVAGAARLGLTHLQLDDGWQKGRSTNSVHSGGYLTSIWDRDPSYWTVDPAKFPRGLEPVIERARGLGVELCLWYNPSRDDGYGHWEKDADQILALHRRYGVRVFKIDGVDIPNKRSETNLRRMFDKVQHHSGGAVVFNLDVTAMRRFGYHHFAEYGNLFLENRYTDWGNWYPHWTLRNLWQLSRYVPAQRLQIEFLNARRNADKYPADDPLAPANVPWAYCFAITMMAQPLAWFECANLPEEAYDELAPAVKAYREHMHAIHAGRIVPIGDEPSGMGWTGFQSITDEASGYVLALREWNPSDHCNMELAGVRGGTVTLRGVAGCDAGREFSVPIAGDGAAAFRLPRPFSFALYRYRCNEAPNAAR